MIHWKDEKTGINFCKPDCVDEWLELIWDIAVDYDGYNTVESLKSLIDEIIDMSKEARECLKENKLFPKKYKYQTTEERCICCGKVIPEGIQVCKECEQKYV